MKNHKAFTIVLGLVLAATVLSASAQASEWEHTTKMVFSGPVEVPGTVLPVGSYWFVVSDLISDRSIVEIFSPDWSKLYAIVYTVPAYRMEATRSTEIQFAERPHKGDEALLRWYFPGRMTGREFIYSEDVEKKLARDPIQVVLATPASRSPRADTSTP